MIKITTNKKINLTQLDTELGGYGLCMNEEDSKKIIVATADNSPITKEQLENGIQAHIAIDDEAARLVAKKALLEKLGITEDESKLLLS